MKKIVLSDIAGYATEKAVWKIISDFSEGWNEGRFNNICPDCIEIFDGKFSFIESSKNKDRIQAFIAPELYKGQTGFSSEAAEVWTLGALSFYALMGVEVFEGKGGMAQTDETEIPRIGLSHCSPLLSSYIVRCLSFSPEGRPTMDELFKIANNALKEQIIPPKRLINATGKTYEVSLVKFWPEEICSLMVFIILSILPIGAVGQKQMIIPVEMSAIVQRCTNLRSPSNIDSVSCDFENDNNWTLMDELEVDRNGECAINEPVEMFGFNEIGFRIVKSHSGVTNKGGRFRNGQDPRYEYSLIKVTAKKNATINYIITGREGYQLFAVIPYDKDATFDVFISKEVHDSIDNKEGVHYIFFEEKLNRKDKFELSIHNRFKKSMSFVIINYNPRN